MAGHDDVYALLASGYTVLFGSNPQEAADLAAIAYRTSALSLIPVANAMDGFSTSHMLSEALLPEPELLARVPRRPGRPDPLPDASRRRCSSAPRAACSSSSGFLDRHGRGHPRERRRRPARLPRRQGRRGREGQRRRRWSAPPSPGCPRSCTARGAAQWVNSWEKGTRQLVPALVDVNNPGLTGPVQNQPDFQAGAVDHRTHFASAVPSLVRQAMSEYSELTGRDYAPVLTYDCDDADVVMIGLGSVGDDVRAVLPHLRAQGIKAGLVSVKLLQPFPEAEVVAALAGKKAVMVLERSDQTALTCLVTAALFRARENAVEPRHDGHPGPRRHPAPHHRDLRPRRARPAAAPPRRRLHAAWMPGRCLRWSTSAPSSSRTTRPSTWPRCRSGCAPPTRRPS